MNMQTSFDHRVVTACIDADAARCLRDLLVTALEIMDELHLPAEIGGHLDLAINRLGEIVPGTDQRATALVMS